MGIIGERSLTCVPTGGRREDAQVPGAKQIEVGTPQDYHRQFEGWLEMAGIQRELVALDSGGQPAWGVEVRAARQGADD